MCLWVCVCMCVYVCVCVCVCEWWASTHCCTYNNIFILATILLGSDFTWIRLYLDQTISGTFWTHHNSSDSDWYCYYSPLIKCVSLFTHLFLNDQNVTQPVFFLAIFRKKFNPRVHTTLDNKNILNILVTLDFSRFILVLGGVSPPPSQPLKILNFFFSILCRSMWEEFPVHFDILHWAVAQI